MKVLFLGDMVGKPSRKAVCKFLGEYRTDKGIDVVIANSDNLAHGKSVTRKTIEEMLACGVDILTCGDHAWDNTQAFDILKAGDLNFVCPMNIPGYDAMLSGKIFEIRGVKILVINLLGKVFMNKEPISPFKVVDDILRANEEEEKAKAIILDFHAETTSEKKAMGHYLEGRVSAVLGTHTHVQTADEEILDNGTAYITDAGMVGVRNSILGCEKDAVLAQFLHDSAFKYQLAERNEVEIRGVLMEIDESTGKTIKIERVKEDIFIPD